jgi:hypothetical protein
MAMKIWQDIFFKEPTQSLTQTCLNLIHDERTGKYVDSMLIRQVVQSYGIKKTYFLLFFLIKISNFSPSWFH